MKKPIIVAAILVSAILLLAATGPIFNRLADIPDATGLRTATNNQVPGWNTSTRKWLAITPPGATGGEANDGANLGTGYGVFWDKAGLNLRFRGLANIDDSLALTTNGTTIFFGAGASIPRLAYTNNWTGPNTLTNGANVISGNGAGLTNLNGSSVSSGTVADARIATTIVRDSRTITVAGTANEITSSAGAQDLSADRTWTLSLPATIDLGGKTSLAIPNAAAPTVDAFGEIAGDNNLWGSGRGAPIFFDGTSVVGLIGVLVSDTPSNGQVPTWNTGGTITWETPTGGIGGSATNAYGIIMEEGSVLTARTNLNFIGGGITATDNSGSGRTDVTLDSDLNTLATLDGSGLTNLNASRLDSGSVPIARIGDDTVTVAKMADGDWGDFTITSNVAAINANAVALATDTTGNFLATAAGTTFRIAVSGSGSENAAAIIDLDATATLAGNPSLSANGIGFATTGIIFEGATANTLEGLLTADDPLADRTWTLPDRSGTISLSGDTFAGDVTGTLSSSGATTLTIAANAVALGTDTTGNFVNDVVGTANEITSTHTPAEGSTATISLPAVIDLGGKTSLEIPNAAAPTVNVFGQIAGDNNLWASGRGAPIFYDGTASVALVGTLVSDVPSSGQVPMWNTGGTITWETLTGTGDVVGPSSAVDNTIARYDGATGKLLQASSVVIDDTGSVLSTNEVRAYSIIGSNSFTLGAGSIPASFVATNGLTISNGGIDRTLTNDLPVLFKSNIVALVPITGDITGNAGTVTVIDTTDSTAFFAIFDNDTGTLAPKTDGGATYSAATGIATFTSLNTTGATITTLTNWGSLFLTAPNNTLPGMVFTSGVVETNQRNWGLGLNYDTTGDFVIRESSTNTTTPFVAGTTRFELFSGGGAAVSGYFQQDEQANPSTPASGKGRWFVSTTGKPSFIDDGGTVSDLSAVSGGGEGSGTVHSGGALTRTDALVRAADATGTNVTTSSITINGGSNLYTASLIATNNVSLLQQAASSAIVLDANKVVTNLAINGTGPISASTGVNLTNVVVTGQTNTDLTASVPVFTDSTKKLTSTGTINAATAGITLTFVDYKDFVYPGKVDGTGCTILTNDYSSPLWGLATFNGTGETNANWSFFRPGVVPLDLDTSVELVVKNLAIRVSATDTDPATLDFGLFSPASSAGHAPTAWSSFGTFIRASVTPSTVAAEDIFYFADITLTGWAAGVTAGRPLIVGIARLNTANDDSITIVSGTIQFTRTQ